MKPFRLEQIRKEQWILLLLVGILIMTAVFSFREGTGKYGRKYNRE